MIPLVLVVALGVGQPAPLPTSLVFFNDDPTWSAAVTFELDSESNGIVPCTNVTIFGAERQCGVQIARTAAQTVRLRSVENGSASGWTAPFGAPVPGSGPLPGAPTIRGFRALP